MDILATAITAVLTVFSPLIIAFYKRESWGTIVKIAVPIAVSIALAVFYLLGTDGLAAGRSVFETIMVIYGVQQLAYTTILSRLATILERVNDPAKTGL